MAFAFRNQPLKAVYMAISLLLLLVKLPVYAIVYVFPQARPRRSWSTGRSLIVLVYREVVNIMYNTAPFLPYPPKSFSGNAEAFGFVWVDAAPELVTGEICELAKRNGVSAERSCGFWFGPKGSNGKAGQQASADEKVVYHFHGGLATRTCSQHTDRASGFIRRGVCGEYFFCLRPHLNTFGQSGSASPSFITMKACFEGLLQYLPGNPRIFALEYRISSAYPFVPSNPFPAALLDAIAGYQYLVKDLDFQPQNIIISGDSAGGLLAFWLARYLAINNLAGLPNGGGLLLLSPAVDWANTHMGPSSSMRLHESSDFIHQTFASKYTLHALLGNLPESEADDNPWIAPGSSSLRHTPGLFAGLPKVCIVAGGGEQTLDAMIALKDRLVTDLGQRWVKYLEIPDATHDFLGASWHEPERTNTLITIAEWVRSEIWPEN